MKTPASQIGAYKIQREIGRGGMGVVYLAHDTRLDRSVAIKALPEHLSTDADRLARFQGEAKVLAPLNHPNIGAIYGWKKSTAGGISSLSMSKVRRSRIGSSRARCRSMRQSRSPCRLPRRSRPPTKRAWFTET